MSKPAKSDKAQNRVYNRYDPKPSTGQHIERVPSRAPGDDAWIVDESLVRAENEDKVTPYLVLIILAAAIAGFLFGYDTGVIGSALPLIGTDLDNKELTYSEQEIITASLTIGAVFSGAILGSLADKLGRKWCLFIADAFFTVGAVLVASSYSIGQMIVGRLLLGVGVGGASVIAPLYITELAPTAFRGRALGTNAFFIPLGQVVSSAIGAGVQNVKHGWRILFAIGVIPSVIQLVLMHWIPESPRVMIIRGDDEAARRTYQKIYRDATPEIIDLKLRVAKNYVEATTQLQRDMTFWDRVKRVWTHKPYRRAIITVSGMQMFGQLTGFNTLLYYSGTLFGLFGFSNGAAAGLIPAGINALFVFVGMSIVDRVGRRRLALIGLPIMVLGMVWAIVSVYFMTAPTDHFLVEGASYDRALAGSLIGAIAFFVVGYGISYSHLGWYQSEFLALEVRAMGSAVATTAVWISNLTVSVAFLTQLETLTPAGTYGLYLGFIICGYIFVYFCYPESKGISVDEIERIYENSFGVKASQRLRAEKTAASKRFTDAEMGGTKQAPSPGVDEAQDGATGRAQHEEAITPVPDVLEHKA